MEPEEQDVIVHAGFEKYALMTDEQVVIMANEEESGTALEYILHKYKNFVRAKARSYFLIGADKEDIVQEGMIGLYKAVSIRRYAIMTRRKRRRFVHLRSFVSPGRSLQRSRLRRGRSISRSIPMYLSISRSMKKSPSVCWWISSRRLKYPIRRRS